MSEPLAPRSSRRIHRFRMASGSGRIPRYEVLPKLSGPRDAHAVPKPSGAHVNVYLFQTRCSAETSCKHPGAHDFVGNPVRTVRKREALAAAGDGLTQGHTSFAVPSRPFSASLPPLPCRFRSMLVRVDVVLVDDVLMTVERVFGTGMPLNNRSS
jgi:hypothetical protein